MKRVITEIILPFIVALSIVFCFSHNKRFNELFFCKKTINTPQKSESRYIANFIDNPCFESQFLKSDDNSEIIYLLGSSELTSQSAALPYNFISKYFTTKMYGVGRAGNQCLSIYTQLLANENRLYKAPIIIIISPGWFESKPSKGTSSTIFLDYNSERFLNRILKQNNTLEYQTYLYQRISQLYHDFKSPSLEIKLMNFKSLESKSFIHKVLYASVILCDEFLLSIKENIFSLEYPDNKSFESFKRPPIVTDSVLINWDSLFKASKQEVLAKSNNNKMGIANDYYSEFINGKHGNIQEVKESNNQEIEDFKMLMKLLKEKNTNACFIISPLNPFYYKNLANILPVTTIIEKEISKNGFPYLNLLETDTVKYDKAMLHDVMHMSDYGWYKVDQFIINTYHLNK